MNIVGVILTEHFFQVNVDYGIDNENHCDLLDLPFVL